MAGFFIRGVGRGEECLLLKGPEVGQNLSWFIGRQKSKADMLTILFED
jgi:hypothetical protein